MNPLHLLFLFLAASFSLAFQLLFQRLAPRLRLLDRPGHRKIHLKAVPKTGGLAILAAVAAAIGAGCLLTGGCGGQLGPEREAKTLLVLGTTLLAGLLGLFDDLYDLRPRYKLALQAALYGAFTVVGFHFEVLHIPGLAPLPLRLLGYLLTLAWMLAVVNGFNFMDGSDGLAASVTLVSLGGMGLASSILNGPNFVGFLWVSAFGAVLVFLVFNWKPAGIYLGDTGSNALGALVATSLVSLAYTRPALLDFPAFPGPPEAVEPYRFQFLTATLLAGYPLLEAALSTLRRAGKRLSYGRSMEWSEQDHLHHRLLKNGFGADAVCLLAVLFQAILALAALLAMVRQNALATWLLLPLAMLLAYLGPRTGLMDLWRLRGAKARPHYQIANHFISMQKVKLSLAGGREEVLALVTQACRELGVRCFRLRVKPDAEGKGGLDYQNQNEETLLVKTEEFLSSQDLSLSEEYYDYCEIPGQRGEAFWVFDSHLGQDELDVEYRILMNGFMREVLDQSIRLGNGLETLDFPSVARLPHHRTSGHHLRKRPPNARMN